MADMHATAYLPACVTFRRFQSACIPQPLQFDVACKVEVGGVSQSKNYCLSLSALLRLIKCSNYMPYSVSLSRSRLVSSRRVVGFQLLSGKRRNGASIHSVHSTITSVGAVGKTESKRGRTAAAAMLVLFLLHCTAVQYCTVPLFC